MSKLTILCDMDGIVADFCQEWVDRINAKFNMSAKISDVKTWDLVDCEAFKHLSDKDLMSIINEPGFFSSLQVIDGARTAIQAMLNDGHDVKFLTAPNGPLSAKEKMEWVDLHFPDVGSANVILTKDKVLVKGDVLIDDRPKTCEDYEKTWPQARVLTIKYPYNKHLENNFGVTVCGNWTDTDSAWGNILYEVRKLDR